MKRSAWVAVATLSLLCSLWVPSAFGQAVYGSILGTVTDPSGAAVTGAKITVTSQTKNVATVATSNESGNYSVTHLISRRLCGPHRRHRFQELGIQERPSLGRHRNEDRWPIPSRLDQ